MTVVTVGEINKLYFALVAKGSRHEKRREERTRDPDGTENSSRRENRLVPFLVLLVRR